MEFLNGNQTDSSTQHRVKKSINYNSKCNRLCCQDLRAILLSVFKHPRQKRFLWCILSAGERFLIFGLNEDSNHWAELCFVQGKKCWPINIETKEPANMRHTLKKQEFSLKIIGLSQVLFNPFLPHPAESAHFTSWLRLVATIRKRKTRGS